VPEVAVSAVADIVKQRLPETEWRLVAEKLAEHKSLPKEPEATLVLFGRARLRELHGPNSGERQALAGLNRWADALPLYEDVANDRGSHFHGRLYLAQRKCSAR